MGEYAKYQGERIKIGTCEDMYYLRWDQRKLVKHESGNVDPVKDAEAIRFRFPFPDEDGKAPGDFEDYDRNVPGLFGLELPEDIEHYSVQFVSNPERGYLLSLPCPESKEGKALSLPIHKNGCGSTVRPCQQRYLKGRLMVVCQCGACGAKYRLEELSEAMPVIEACRNEALKQRMEGEHLGDNGAWWDKVADRIEAGYKVNEKP